MAALLERVFPQLPVQRHAPLAVDPTLDLDSHGVCAAANPQRPGPRPHGARLRHQLLRGPARVLRHAGGLTLRLPPGPQLLSEILARLRALPSSA